MRGALRNWSACVPVAVTTSFGRVRPWGGLGAVLALSAVVFATACETKTSPLEVDVGPSRPTEAPARLMTTLSATMSPGEIAFLAPAGTGAVDGLGGRRLVLEDRGQAWDVRFVEGWGDDIPEELADQPWLLLPGVILKASLKARESNGLSFPGMLVLGSRPPMTFMFSGSSCRLGRDFFDRPGFLDVARNSEKWQDWEAFGDCVSALMTATAEKLGQCVSASLVWVSDEEYWDIVATLTTCQPE